MKNIIEKYLTEKIRSREIDGNEPEWGLTSDGWNEKDLEDAGVMEFIETVERVAYELKNTRRGSYAKFGDTIKDLAYLFKGLSRDAKDVEKEIKGYIKR